MKDQRNIGREMINKQSSFEVLSDCEAAHVIGGNVLVRAAKMIYRAARDGAIYDAIIAAGMWVKDRDPQPTEHDMERIEAGYTHVGGRQPWI